MSGRYMTPGRLIVCSPRKPAENMALDQALHESVDASASETASGNQAMPVLRLYRWIEPTLSLGYFQKLADRRQHPASESVAFVRRATGGGAILHDREWTYSLVVPAQDAMRSGANAQLYRQVHAAIIHCLSDVGVQAVPHRKTGSPRVWAQSSGSDLAPESLTSDATEPFLCFQRRTDEDLVVAGYKILGSAQRRRRRAVLQHGSLLVGASPMAPELPGLVDLGGPRERLQAGDGSPFPLALANQIGRLLSIDWRISEFSEDEWTRASKISQEKFSSMGWLSKR